MQMSQSRGVYIKDYLKWAGIVHSIPQEWKDILVSEKNLNKYKNLVNEGKPKMINYY